MKHPTLYPATVRLRGFTLIELMVVVAVLAIIATIAIPAYTRMMNSVRRADGRAMATAIAHAEERFFSIYQRYNVDLASLVSMAGLDAQLQAGKSVKGHYQLDTGKVKPGASNSINTSFLVTLNPIDAQANDLYCKTMTIDSEGVKSGTYDSNYELKCWFP